MGNVSAIVIHYEGHQFVKRCLEALSKLPEIKEIVFVDDGSRENPEELVRPSGATFLRTEDNRGPIAARNLGARHATGDYLLFVDVDALPAPDYATRIVTRFEEDPRIGVATGRMMENGSRTWFNFGYEPSVWRGPLESFFGRAVILCWHVAPLRRLLMRLARPFTLNFVNDDPRDVDWVIERGFVTRRDLFEELGGLDERFFMFFEGPDYCRRAREAGYRVIYVPDAVCDHMGGHSHSPAKRAVIFAKARIAYFRKWAG